MSATRDQSMLGLVAWKPRPGSASARCLVDVLAVLEEWVGSGVVPSLTARAILYRLLPLGWDKSDDDHPLGHVLERARRAQMIPFEWIADGRSEHYVPYAWSDPDEFRATWRQEAAHYRLDRLTGQSSIELWIETAGMLEMLRPLAEELGTPLYCSSGMNTLSTKHEAAQRIISNRERGNVIVFTGDLDPWGEARYENVRRDAIALARDIAGVDPVVSFVTAALTREQVAAYDIPTEPCKRVFRAGKEITLPEAGVQEIRQHKRRRSALISCSPQSAPPSCGTWIGTASPRRSSSKPSTEPNYLPRWEELERTAPHDARGGLLARRSRRLSVSAGPVTGLSDRVRGDVQRILDREARRAPTRERLERHAVTATTGSDGRARDDGPDEIAAPFDREARPSRRRSRVTAGSTVAVETFEPILRRVPLVSERGQALAHGVNVVEPGERSHGRVEFAVDPLDLGARAIDAGIG